MKRSWLPKALLALALFTGSCEAFDLTPKAFLSTGIGLLSNQGSDGGSAFSIGGLNLSLALYPLPILSAYAGYSLNFDLSNGSLPLSGFYAGSRFYFWGQGTRVQHEISGITSTTRSKISAYAGVEVAQRSYYIPASSNTANGTSGTGSGSNSNSNSSSNSTNSTNSNSTNSNTSSTTGTTGSSFALNGTLGAELSLTEHFDVNVEVNSTILTFAASDSRYRIAGTLFRIGLGLLF